MSKITVEEFRNFFKYYKGEEHQIRGVDEPYLSMDSDLLVETADWIKEYRNKTIKPNTPVSDGAIYLKVPYQSQLDNASGTGYRECFSSSCAMVAMYYGKVANDDEYNLVRAKYGDSTDAAAQCQALRELGLEARFVTNGTTDDVRHLLEKGQPVPVGWLHKGPVEAPTGGGHWSVIIGYKTAPGLLMIQTVKLTLFLVDILPTRMVPISSTATRTSTHVGSLVVKAMAGIWMYEIQ